LNIIGLSTKTSGCGYHRVLLPLGFMEGIKGYVTNIITEDKSEGWDILLYNRISVYDKDWNKAKELLSCKVVLDLDDYWKLPPNHLNHGHYEEFGPRIEKNIGHSDLVTVTNEALLNKVKQFTDNVIVLPNALPFGRNQFTYDRRKSDRVRIFWAGGATHEPDLKLLKNPIQRLIGLKDKIQMVLGGYCDSDTVSKYVWDRMFSYFTAGGKLPYMKLHGTGPTDYMQMYENADIMVIPLEDTDWHSCKSNLKILEAASKRIPVIVSNVAPYNQDKDAPVLWVNNQKDWFSHLNYLINNPDAREYLGNKLYEWAKHKYNLADINRRRFEAFSSICETPAFLPVL
jgi:glycosyltransferase involved in cell wall biosynthesis